MKKMNVGYLRVSTEAQTEKYGLDLQKNKILERARSDGNTIDRWYVDGGYSGSKLERPEIQRLLEDVKTDSIDSVYVYKLDRMSRDTIDALTLLYRFLPEHNVKLVSVTEELNLSTPMDKVIVGVNAMMGQYEREVIYMRTRAGMIERVKKGLWMGGGRTPYGYYYDRNDGILHVKEDEAKNVRKMYEMYNAGYSCEKIAIILGIKWDKIVLNILKRKSNLGYIEYKGEIYKGKHEAIIDEETYYKTQELMKKRSSNSYVNNHYMLSGLCWCGKCGARMRYKKWGNYMIMECYSRDKPRRYMVKDTNCKNKRIKTEYVEKEVIDCFKKFSINIEKAEAKESNRSIIEKEIKKTTDKLKKLYSLYAESESDTLLSVIEEEEKRLKSLKNDLDNEIREDSSKKEVKIEEIKNMANVWDTLDAKEKNKILKECIEKIAITDGDIEIYFKV